MNKIVCAIKPLSIQETFGRDERVGNDMDQTKSVCLCAYITTISMWID